MNSNKPASRSFLQRRKFTMHPLSLAVLMSLAGPAAALPTGSSVVSGQVTVQNQSSTLQIVTQGTQRGVIDWKSFSIASGETVRFNQPSTTAVLLNRVTGYDPSSILGQMQSNGRIFLLNPHGIVFGASARVDVGGMVASTLSLSNADFNAGRYQLTSAAGEARGSVRNDGLISASGGTVALVAPKVENRGTIEADGGRVGLAAANSVLVDVEGDGLIFFNASASEAGNRLAQLGRIQADGGTVDMRAAARASMADTVLNLSGVVQARSLTSRDGKVFIDGGQTGITAVRGVIDVRGGDAAADGGNVDVTGRYVLLDRGTRIDARGADGGDVRVGGGFRGVGLPRNALRLHADRDVSIDVSGRGNGDGGLAVLWADDFTRFQGRIAARGGDTGGDGGLVEVSGKKSLDFAGNVDTRAAHGRTGTLLLDPTNITISTAADSEATPFTNGADDTFNNGGGATATLNRNTLQTQLATTSVIVDTTSGNPAAGNIAVDASITWASGFSLTLAADGGITVGTGNTITNTGTGALALNADGAVALNAAVRLHGGNFSVDGKTAARALSFTASAAGTIDTTASAAGQSGGAVTIDTSGPIVTSSITTVGAAGGAGQPGGLGGAVLLRTTDGPITVNGNITTSGGLASNNASTTLANRLGGAAGNVTLEVTLAPAASDITVTGTITAVGGQGGNGTGAVGGGGADDIDDDGGTGGAGGAVAITANNAGSITVGAITTTGGRGGDGTELGGRGGVGGTVTLRSLVGGSVTAGVVSAGGGQGGVGLAGGDDDGGIGGDGAAVQLLATLGSVSVAGVTTSGGLGGNGDDDGGAGGAAGTLTLTATGPGNNVTSTGALRAEGGVGGNRLNNNDTNEDGGDGGVAAAVSVSAAGGAVSVQTVSSSGGAGGTGDSAGAQGAGANLTLTAGTDLVVAGDVIAVTNGGTNTTINLNFGQGAASGTFDLSGITALTADDINISVGVGGLHTLIVTGNSNTLTLGDTSLGLNGATIDLAGFTAVDAAVVSSLAPNTNINVSGWLGTSRVLVTGGNVNLLGRDANTTIVGPAAGASFLVTDPNVGSVGTMNFTAVGRLEGGIGADSFTFDASGTLSGGIDGGAGPGLNTLNLAQKASATFSLETSSVAGIVPSFARIDVLQGNGTGFTLVGANGASEEFVIDGANSGRVTGGPSFSGIANLAGGGGDDTFSFEAGGSLTSVAGDSGNDVVSVANLVGQASYNLQAGTVVVGGVSTAVTSIASFVGNGATSTVVGSDAGLTFTINAVNGGTAGGLAFSGVGNLQGGSGADTFTGAGGSLSGNIDAGASTTTLNGTIETAGSQTYSGAVGLGSAVTLISGVTGNNAAVTFGSTVTNPFPLVINTQGITTFTGDVTAITSLTTDVGGTTVLPAWVFASGDIRILDAAVGGNVKLTVSTGGEVVLGQGSNVGTLDLDIIGSTGVTVFDADSLTLGAVSVAGGAPINFTVAQSLSRGAPLAIGGATLTLDVGNAVVHPTVRDVFALSDVALTSVTIDAGTLAGTHDLTMVGLGALPTLSVSGNLDVDSNNNPITQGGALLVTGTTRLDSGTASIELMNPANDFGGAVSLLNTNGGIFAARIRDLDNIEFGTSSLGAGSIEVYAGGDITQTGAIVQVGASPYAYFTTTNGKVELLNPNNDFTGEVYLQGNGSILAVRDVNDLTLNLAFFVNGTNTGIGAIAGGALTLVPGGPVNFSTGTGEINLQALGGALNLGGGSTLTTTSGAITLASRDALSVQGVSTGSGNLSFTSTLGGVTLNQAVTTGVSGSITVQALGGALTLSPGASLQTAGGGITLTSQDALTVQSVTTVGGNLSFTSTAGNVFLAQPVTTGGSISLSAAAGSLNLTGATISAGQDVNLVAGAGGISNSGGGTLNVGGTLTGVSGGGVDLTGTYTNLGPFTSNGTTRFLDTAGGLTVTGVVDSGSGSLQIQTTGSLTVGGIGLNGTGLALSGTTGVNTGGATLDAGAGTLSISAASGAVTLGGGSLDGASVSVSGSAGISTGGAALTATGGSVFLNATSTGALNLGASTLTATAGVTLGGGLGISGSGAINAGSGDIVVQGFNTGNVSLLGPITTTSNTATAARFVGAPVLTLGQVQTGATGSVSLGIVGFEVGDVNPAGPIQTGTLLGAATGTVDLDGFTNAITNLGPFTAGSLQLADAGGLTLTGAVAATAGPAAIGTSGLLNLGTHSITASGGVTLAANGGIASTSGGVSAGGDILINGFGANISLGGLVQTTSNSATALVIRNADNVTLGGGIATGAAGTTTLGIAGDITGDVLLGGTATFSTGTLTGNVGGAVTLDSTIGSVGTLSNFTAGGNFLLRDTGGGLTVNNVASTAGTVTIIVPNGSLALSGGSLVQGSGVALSAGELSLGTGSVAGGVGGIALTATNGDILGNGSISTPGALSVNASAGSVILSTAVGIGSLGASTVAGDLELSHSGSLLVTGPVVVGGLTTLVASADINQIGAGTINTGVLDVTAGGNVVLDLANQVGTLANVSVTGGFALRDSTLGLSVTGPVTAAAVDLRAVGALALGASPVTSTAGNVVLIGNGVTGTGNINVAGTLGVDGLAGGINLSGPIDAAVLTGSTTAGATFGNLANAIDTLGDFSANGLTVIDGSAGLIVNGTVSAGTGTLSIATSGGALAMGNSAVSGGTVSLTGVGVTQTAGGSVTATGPSIINGGSGGINLASVSNEFIGAVTLQRTGGAISLRDTSDLTVASIDAVANQSVTIIADDNLTVNTGGLLAIGTGILTLQAINGVLTLTGDVGANLVDFSADAISLAGTITTTGNQTYTGLVTLLGSLEMVAGGTIDIQAGASGTGDLTVTATQGITLGGDVAVTASLTSTGAQTYNSAVTLSSDVVLSAGVGGVTFNGTVDGTQALTVNTAGTTAFNGRVGGTTSLVSLTTDAPGTTVIAGGDAALPFVTTTGNQLYNDPVFLLGDTVFQANKVTFGSTFNGGTGDVEFRVSEQTTFVGAITSTGGIILSTQSPTDDISVVVDTGGLFIDQATLNSYSNFGRIVLGGATYDGDVRFGSVLLPTDLRVRTLSGDVTFNGTVNSAATPEVLTVNAGGLTTFNGVVGGTGVLASLTVSGDTLVNTSAVTTTGVQSYGGDVALGAAVDPTLTAASIQIGGTLSTADRNLTLLADALDVAAVAGGSGILTVAGLTPDTDIGIATADIGGRLDISQVLLDKLGQVDNLVIGLGTGAGTITANAFTLPSNLSLRSGSGEIRFNGTVDSGAANQSLDIDTAGAVTFSGAVGGATAGTALSSLSVTGVTAINGGSVRTLGAQLYEDNVTLGANTTLTGSAVTFGGTVDGARTLAVNASGATVFNAAVGGAVALTSLTTDAGGTLELRGNVRTTGNQAYGDDAVQLNADTALSGARVTVAGTVNGAHALQITAAGGVTLNGGIGGSTALDSLQVSGPTSLGANVVTTTGVQSYTGPVTLTGAATTLTASALDFSSTVDGPSLLTLQVAGLSVFGGNVGAAASLAGLDSQGAGAVQLLGSSIRTSGAQSYDGALQVSGDTVLTAASLSFASGLSGAGNLALRTDQLSAGAAIDGDGVLTISPLTRGRTIGIAGGAGELQIAQSILTGATNFSRHVIGRADGTGDINAGNTRLTADTRLLSATGDIRLNGSVDGAFNLQLDTGGETRIAGPVGANTPLISLTTDNAAAADWNGSTGERTLFDGEAARARVITVGDQTYNDAVVNTVPVALTGAIITAQNEANEFGVRLPDGSFSTRALDLSAQTVVLRSGQSIELGNVTLSNGGSVETGGVLRLSGALLLEGGTLLLRSTATPTALAEFSDPELQEDKPLGVSFEGVPVREASAAIEQTETSSISTGADTLLILRASNGGSVNLTANGNNLLGEVSAVSGQLGETGTARFDGPNDILVGFVRLNSTQIRVAGAPPADGDQSLLRAGIEGDAVWLRADAISTGLTGQIRARLPFNNVEGTNTSLPGLTLVMSEAALANGGGFGGNTEESWIQVRVGDERGGFLTVRPKGENGPNAFILLGGEVTAQPFYDGAGKVTEVRVFYNGATPRTAQESGALSAVQAVAEEARQSRFEEAVRTENVRARLRSGVIAEVGAGRPATVGAEGIRQPDNCEVKGSTLQCQ